MSGYDKSYRMRHNQPEPTEYNYMNASIIAAELAGLNGLVPVVDPVPSLPEKVLQTDCDMTFLKSLAEPYFFDVYVEWDRLHFQLPRPQFAAHVLEWGRNLSSFNPRISSAASAGLQVIRGYNQELAQSIYAEAAGLRRRRSTDLVERLGSAALEMLGSLVRKGIHRQPVDSQLDAAELAKSLLSHLLEGMYEGTGTCIGIPDLAAGRYVEIRGVGRRFGGTYRARKVTHRLDASGFMTTFSISQRGNTSLLGLLRKHVVDAPSPHQPQPFYGVVVGTVQDNNETLAVPPTTPLGRVKVAFPGLSESFTSGWAPCARPMAGSDSGFYALPEVGDQVLVAFEHGDLGRPYVLGALWAVGSEPPETNADGLNNRRVIQSRAGHTITFDDTSPAGKLVIADQAGSSITLDSSDGSISIEAKQDLTISAAGDLTLRAAEGQTTIAMTADAVDIS